jgi:HD-like signal output (HDOD) protein
VLKIANSSFYSISRKVETIHHAIVLLGFATLRSVVVAASMKDVFGRYGLAERLLWEHATAAGVAAAGLTRQLGGLSSDEALLGGLVHDIGKLVMHSQAESRYQEVMRAVYAEEATATEAEREVFGFDHAEIGRLLLMHWKLPEPLFAAVGAHHDIERAGKIEGAKPLAAILQLADRMCLREGFGRRKPLTELDPLDCPAGEILGLDPGSSDDLLADFRQDFEREREMLG